MKILIGFLNTTIEDMSLAQRLLVIGLFFLSLLSALGIGLFLSSLLAGQNLTLTALFAIPSALYLLFWYGFVPFLLRSEKTKFPG